MKGLQLLKRAAVGLSVLGMSVPQGQIFAAEQAVTVQTAQASAVTDVALSAGGTLTGHVVDNQGIALDGAAVVIRQGGQEVARTVSDSNGVFAVTSLRGGLHQISAGQGSQTVRLWAENTAPPAARDQALIVSGSQTVRGQMGGPGSVLLVGGVLAAVILSAIAIDQNNDIKDKLDEQPPMPMSP